MEEKERSFKTSLTYLFLVFMRHTTTLLICVYGLRYTPPVRMLYCLERRTANASNTLGWISSLNLKSLNEKQALLYSNYENPYLRVIVKCIRDHTHICLNVFAFKTEN